MRLLHHLLCVLTPIVVVTGCTAAVDSGTSADSADQSQSLENGREIPISIGSAKKAKLFGNTNPSRVFVVIGGIKGDVETTTFARSIADHFAIDSNESALPRGAGVIVIEDPTDTDINATFACNQNQMNNTATTALASFLSSRKASLRGVVSLRSFRLADAYAGRCGTAHGPSDTLSASYASNIHGTQKVPIPGTGNLVDWLAKEGVAAVEVGANGTAALHANSVQSILSTITLSLYTIPQTGEAVDAYFQEYEPTVTINFPCQVTAANSEVTVNCGTSSFTAPIEEDEDWNVTAHGRLTGSLINVNCQGGSVGQFTSGTDTYAVEVVFDWNGNPWAISLDKQGSNTMCGEAVWRFRGSL